jgi:hypothetical protein
VYPVMRLVAVGVLDVGRTSEWGVACRRPTSIRRFSCLTVVLV